MSANFRTPLTGASILVAEDESLIAMDFVDALRDAGASIVGPAASLADAYRLAAAPIDLACLDVDLRGEKIFPFADMLRERASRLCLPRVTIRMTCRRAFGRRLISPSR